MNEKLYQWFRWLLWLALPLTALHYWQVWDRLPARMATHFGASGQPNGWMSREGALKFILVLMTFMLMLGTVILSRLRKPQASSWAVLGLFLVIIGLLYWSSEAVLAYNLHGGSVSIGSATVLVPLAVIALIGIVLGSKRGPTLPPAGVIAEEVHTGRVWAAVIAIPLAFELAMLLAVPIPTVRLGLGLIALVLLLAAALGWDGFHYLFTASGMEIRTLGFRLRSIPCDHIEGYEVDRWTALRGYGIRGIGNCRAYVWGNKVVHIKTIDGDVFLGHADPQRIIRDLDMITRHSQAQQVSRG